MFYLFPCAVIFHVKNHERSTVRKGGVAAWVGGGGWRWRGAATSGGGGRGGGVVPGYLSVSLLQYSSRRASLGKQVSLPSLGCFPLQPRCCGSLWLFHLRYRRPTPKPSGQCPCSAVVLVPAHRMLPVQVFSRIKCCCCSSFFYNLSNLWI